MEDLFVKKATVETISTVDDGLIPISLNPGLSTLTEV